MDYVLLAFPLAFMQEGNEVQTRLLVFRSGASHVTTPDGSSTLISPPTYHLLQPVAFTAAAFASSQSPHSPTASTAPTYHLLQPVAGTSSSYQIARCSPISSTSNPSQSTEPGPNSNAEVPTATATASENERSPIANSSQGALSSRGRTRMTKAQTTKKT